VKTTVSAWRGGTYGIRFSKDDRDAFVDRDAKSVKVVLAGWAGPSRVKVSKSFWKKCPQLRSAEIGRWLKARALAPWPEGRPPKLVVTRWPGESVLYVEPE
jgi:hypothetical protein